MPRTSPHALVRCAALALLAGVMGCQAPEPPKAVEPPPAPRPAPTPVPIPRPEPPPEAPAHAEPPAPRVQPVALIRSATVWFDYKESALTAQATAVLDQEIIARLGEFASIEVINVTGYADRIASRRYNQTLSERRAHAVKTYLISRNAQAARIQTHGFGSALPVKTCDEPERSALIACLAPNRRVVVQVKGRAAR